MAVWKQLILVVFACVIGVFAWVQLAPHAATTPETAASRPGDARGGASRGAPRANRVVAAEVSEIAADGRVVAIGDAEAFKHATIVSETAGIVTEIAVKPGQRVRTGDVIVRLDDDDQRLAVEQAKVNLRTIEDKVGRYERLDSRSIPEIQLIEAQAERDLARNQLSTAEVALARRTVKAPFDGVVGFLQVEIGDALTVARPIVNIDDRSSVFVIFRVPERFSALVAPGGRVSATTAAYGNEQFTGEVEATDSRIDSASRGLQVRAQLPNDDDRLRPGMSFSVTMDFAAPNRPAVPVTALQWDRDGAYVWKVVDGKAHRARVEVIGRKPNAVLVDGDIRPKEMVIAEGHDGLREGADVSVWTAKETSGRADLVQPVVAR
jgi:RND family efflux transporter MFP subunit